MTYQDINANESHEIVWDFGDDTQSTGMLAPSHSFLIAGTYSVTLTVTDETGFSISDMLIVSVKPVSQLDRLIPLVEQMYEKGFITQRGVYQSLTEKLLQAQKEYEKGKLDNSTKKLTDFIQQVNKESGKHIQPDAAQTLISSANLIIANIPK